MENLEINDHICPTTKYVYNSIISAMSYRRSEDIVWSRQQMYEGHITKNNMYGESEYKWNRIKWVRIKETRDDQIWFKSERKTKKRNGGERSKKGGELDMRWKQNSCRVCAWWTAIKAISYDDISSVDILQTMSRHFQNNRRNWKAGYEGGSVAQTRNSGGRKRGSKY